MTNRDHAMLTIALHHASKLKVQTALIEGKKDLARELLRGYVEGELAEANYILEDLRPEGLLPHERAAKRLNEAPGPLLRHSINWVLRTVIPD